jgi:hypothetical protein
MSDELAVQQVLARYVRAHDRRDGAAIAALFTPEARVTIFYNNNPDGKPELIGELAGREAIAQATTHLMKPRSSLAITHRSWFAWRDSGSSSRCRFAITCRLPSEVDG